MWLGKKTDSSSLKMIHVIHLICIQSPSHPHLIMANIDYSNFISQRVLEGDCLYFKDFHVKNESLSNSSQLTGGPDYKTLPLQMIIYPKCCKGCQPNYALSENICS